MFTKLFVALAVLGVSAQSAVAAGCTRSYTIKEGDYCDLISQQQNVSTYQLAAINQGTVNNGCSNLVPGESLCLAEDPKEDCQTTYLVLPGDTCEAIAQKNALNMTLLYLNNPQINEDCSNIYGGEVLCTSKSVQAPPIPSSGVALPAPNASSTTLVAASTASPVAVGTPVPAAPAEPVSVSVSVSHVTPAAPVTTQAKAAATPAPSPSADGDDGDDEDLPFCDEL